MASGTCRYSLECSPLGYSKWPTRNAPVSRSTVTTSSCVGMMCIRLPLSAQVRARPKASIRPVAGEHAGDGTQQNLPVQRQGPVIDVLHVELHPSLEIHVVAPRDEIG